MSSENLLKIPQYLAKALENIGKLTFYTELLNGFSEFLPTADRYVLRYNSYAPPELLYYDGAHQPAVDLYMESLYKIDPFFQLCAGSSQSGVARLRDQRGSAEEFQKYFSFMSGVGFNENLTVMLPVIGGTTIILAWDFLDPDYLVTGSSLGILKQFHQVTLAFHQLQVEALTSRPGEGLLVEHAKEPWVAAAQNSEIICHGGNWARADLQGLLNYVKETPPEGPEFRYGGERWTLDRMSPKNAVAPSGWFLQKRDITGRAGPASFDEAFGELCKAGLTPREQATARLTLQGHHNASIAAELNLSHQVVKNYKAAIYTKLDVTSERELFRRFLGVILNEEMHQI